VADKDFLVGPEDFLSALHSPECPLILGMSELVLGVNESIDSSRQSLMMDA
jgi:hypothetical protein